MYTECLVAVLPSWWPQVSQQRRCAPQGAVHLCASHEPLVLMACIEGLLAGYWGGGQIDVFRGLLTLQCITNRGFEWPLPSILPELTGDVIPPR